MKSLSAKSAPKTVSPLKESKNFSIQCWNDVSDIYESITKHPFNQELAAGILPVEKFEYYMLQDAIYLVDFARVLALISAKLEDKSRVIHFIEAAREAIIVERALHEDFFTHFKIKANHQSWRDKKPACDHYTNFLIATTSMRPAEVAIAAILPCFWIYREVGKNILSQSKANQNPFQKWIDTYSSEQFSLAVDNMIEIANIEYNKSSLKDEMRHYFVRSSIHEYKFWDDAYNLRDWPQFSNP